MMDDIHSKVSFIKRKKQWIGVILLALITTYFMFSMLLPYEVPQAKIYNLNKENRTIKSKYKSILYWNDFFGVKDMYFGVGNSIFNNCSVSTCYATYNKSVMPSEYYDAVIFHAPRYSVYHDGVPKNRSIHQKYIFYSLESPYNIYFDKSVNENFYNWTMTYRKDSDIHHPYSLVVETPTNYQPPSIENLRNRTKKVAWFVSNCKTKGAKRRLKYAEELSKYIPVDIYGKCGTKICKNYNECYKMLERNYKFYLSFENSMCKDYVTEKLFNVLKYDIIPIVLGYFDYSSIAPKNSVINTHDYVDPKTLAKYLWELDHNYEDYLKYFEWKKSYIITTSIKYVLCQLCKLLHQPLKYSSYDNIEDWFYGYHCVS